MDNTSNAPGDGTTPEPGSPQGQTPNPQGLTPNGSQKTPIAALPPDIQDYIKTLREEAKALNKEKEAEAQAKRQAEEARLKEQGEYKTLAEKHEARVRELEPLAQSYTQLATLVSGQIEAQIKDWPEEVRAFDPGKDAPIEQRLAWIEKSRALVAKLQGQARPAGNGPNPRPAGGAQHQQANVEELRQRYRSTGKYSF